MSLYIQRVVIYTTILPFGFSFLEWISICFQGKRKTKGEKTSELSFFLQRKDSINSVVFHNKIIFFYLNSRFLDKLSCILRLTSLLIKMLFFSSSKASSIIFKTSGETCTLSFVLVMISKFKFSNANLALSKETHFGGRIVSVSRHISVIV